MNKILCAAALCLAALAATSCKTDKETVYITPDDGISRFTVSPLKVTMGCADDVEFLVAVRPGNTAYTWESSDPSIAYVDENDHIVALEVGEVELTATAGDYSQTIPVSIHSSVIVNTSGTVYVDEGDSSDLSFVQVVPATMPFTVTSSNPAVVNIPDETALGFKAEGSGLSTITITAEDGQKASFQMGVAAADNVINATAADAYYYPGAKLGHEGYDIVALALQPSGVTYTDGGTWDASNGKGVFLKLFKSSSYTNLPDGEYTAGTGDHNFYATNTMSYVIDGTTKTALTAGSLSITDSGISGYVSSNNAVFKVNFSGKLTRYEHELIPDIVIDINNEWADGTSQMWYDSAANGTIWGGYTGTHQFKIANSASNTNLLMMLWPKDADDPSDSYTFQTTGSPYNGKGQVTGGSQTSYSRFRNGSTTNYQLLGTSSLNISDFKIVSGNKTTSGSTVSATMKGTINSSMTSSVSEINETQTVPIIINLDVEDLIFTVVTSRITN